RSSLRTARNSPAARPRRPREWPPPTPSPPPPVGETNYSRSNKDLEPGRLRLTDRHFGKADISTLQGTGHLYFVFTTRRAPRPRDAALVRSDGGAIAIGDT